MQLHMIYARAANGVIGRTVNGVGTLPWRLPEDLAHFKRTTMGHPVIMGRKTWDSLPARFRPLPGRENVVVTGNASYDAPGATLASSLDEALSGGDMWVIGGANVYAEAIEWADVLEVTEVDLHVDGDTRAPVIDSSWLLSECSPAEGWHESSVDGVRYRFLTYRRSPQAD